MSRNRRAAVLITGASSGIGAAIARRLSARSPLILHGRSEERLRAVRESLAEPEAHQLWLADFADAHRAPAAVEEFLETCSSTIQAVVHSAGVTSVGPIRSVSPEDAHRMFAVNVFAADAIVRGILARPSKAGSLKNIVLISSAAALRGEKGAAVYAASKAALDALGRCLAAELAPAVRVNVVMPGLVATQMAASTLAHPDFETTVAPRYPLGIGSTENVVDAVDQLLSARTRWVTGASWVVDGGTTAAGISGR